MKNQKNIPKYFCARVMADTNLYQVKMNAEPFKYGAEVVIGTEFGEDLAFITSFPFTSLPQSTEVKSARFLRYADNCDKEAARQKLVESRSTRSEIAQMAKDSGVKMNITHVLLPLKGETMAVFYTAKGRVDFRELLKNLRTRFGGKVIMRQIGSKARMDSFFLDSRTPANRRWVG